MKKLLFFSILFLFLINIQTHATHITVQGGEINTNVNWSVDTVFVEGSVTVNDGASLTIESGTYIEFRGHYKLKILGQLLAIGTETDSIIFTVADTTGLSYIDTSDVWGDDIWNIDGGWHGIRFDSTAATNDTSVISYCKFEYAKAVLSPDDTAEEAYDDGHGARTQQGSAIYIRYFSKLLISNCTFVNNVSRYDATIFCETASPMIINNVIKNNRAADDAGAIRCTDAANPIIKNNIIDNNFSQSQAGAIYCVYGSSPVISGNTITNNSTLGVGGGIIAATVSNPLIIDNTISNNVSVTDGGGIYCFNLADPIIQGNVISGNSCQRDGGGIYCLKECDPTITDNLIENNTSDNGAGIFCFYFSSPTITDVTIINNHATNNGGGIVCKTECSPIIENNIISNNIADNEAGGILSKLYCNPTITNNTITNNIAIGNGGGVCFSDTSGATLTNNIIENNTADNGAGIFCVNHSSPILTDLTIINNYAYNNGGGIALKGDCHPVISNNVITDNIAENDAGGITCKLNSNASIKNNLIQNNISGGNGGGLYCEGSYPIVTNNNIDSNSANNGGGVFCFSQSYAMLIGNLITNNIALPDSNAGGNGGGICCKDSADILITNCTISDNEAENGGGIFIRTTSNPTLTNSIIWWNYPNQVYLNDDDCDPDFYYCDVAGGTIGFDGDGAGDEYFGDYEYNIYDIPNFVNEGEHPYALNSSSSCIDAGDSDTSGLYLPIVDIAEYVRIQNDRIDMGAYEYGNMTGIPTSDGINAPAVMTLYPNFPNPFNPVTTITYDLAVDSHVTLKIYNPLGQAVKTIHENQPQFSGRYYTKWAGTDDAHREVPSGIYFYRLTVNGNGHKFTETRKMTLLR